MFPMMRPVKTIFSAADARSMSGCSEKSAPISRGLEVEATVLIAFLISVSLGSSFTLGALPGVLSPHAARKRIATIITVAIDRFIFPPCILMVIFPCLWGRRWAVSRRVRDP